MYEAHSRNQWNHTASVMALMATAWLRKNGAPPARVQQFHPWLRGKSRGARVTAESLPHLAKAMGAKEVYE